MLLLLKSPRADWRLGPRWGRAAGKKIPSSLNTIAYVCRCLLLCNCRLAYGLENGIVIVDFIQKCVLLNISTADMYGSADPYQRAPRSPKRTTALSETASDGERCRSPSIDQVIYKFLLRFFHTRSSRAHIRKKRTGGERIKKENRKIVDKQRKKRETLGLCEQPSRTRVVVYVADKLEIGDARVFPCRQPEFFFQFYPTRASLLRLTSEHVPQTTLCACLRPLPPSLRGSNQYGYG